MYEELERRRAMSEPTTPRPRSEAGQARDAKVRKAQARFDLVRKRQGGKIVSSGRDYQGKHRKGKTEGDSK